MTRREKLFRILISTISIFIGSWVIYFSSYNGKLSLSHDGVSYIEGARNIYLKGEYVDYNGENVKYWPPIYSATLAVFSIPFEGNIEKAGIILNITCLTILLICFNIIFSHLRANLWLTIFLNALMISSKPLGIYGSYLSETLFLAILSIILCLLSLNLIINYKWSIILGILSGILFLTRYAGLPILMSTGLLVTIRFHKTKKINLIGGLLFLCGLLLTLIPYLLLSFSLKDDPRQLSVHIISFFHLKLFAAAILMWINPIIEISAIILIFLASYILFSKRKIFEKINFIIKSEIFFNLIFITISYLSFLVFSISFIDHATPLDSRIISPLYLIFIVLLAIFLSNQPIQNLSNKVTLFLGFFSLTTSLYSYLNSNYKLHHFGNGYTGSKWQDSEIIYRLKENKNLILYSNAAEGIRYLIPEMARNSKSLPYIITDPAFNNLLNKDLMDSSGVKSWIIYFYEKKNRTKYSVDELQYIFKGRSVQQFPDGIIIM